MSKHLGKGVFVPDLHHELVYGSDITAGSVPRVT